MLTLPGEYTTIMSCVAHLVSKRIWQHAQLLLIGAILAPGQRIVAAVLRMIYAKSAQRQLDGLFSDYPWSCSSNWLNSRWAGTFSRKDVRRVSF